MIPVADPNSNAPKVCTVDQIFLYLEAALGVNEIPVFSTTSDYAAPDLVKYNNVLYRFVAYKAAGVWDSSKVVQTSIFEELQAMRDGDNETVNVTVASGDNNLNIEGLVVTMEANGAVTNATTDENGIATFSVAKGVKYTLSMSDQQGYYHVPTKAFRATYNERYVLFNFVPNVETLTGYEAVNVCLSVGTTGGTSVFQESNGENVQYIIDGDSETHNAEINNGWAVFNVPINSHYTIIFPQISGFSQPQNMQFVASLENRYVMAYYAWYIGDDDIRILADDDVEYTIAAYDALATKPTGIAIHVQPLNLLSKASGLNDGKACDFYIDVNLVTASKQILNQNVNITGLPQIGGSTSGVEASDCHYNLTGMLNTSKILEFVQNNSGYTSAAATWASEKTLTTNSRTLTGFIGAFGQLWAIKSALTSINAALALTSGKVLNINNGTWWSSTQYNYDTMWRLNGGSPNGNGKNYSYTVLPLFA